MNHNEIEQKLLERIKLCQLPVLQRKSLPFECYWKDSMLIQEQKHIFSNQWIGLGRSDRLKNTGEYEVFELQFWCAREKVSFKCLCLVLGISSSFVGGGKE